MVCIVELNFVYDMVIWVVDGDFEKFNGLIIFNLVVVFFFMFGIDVLIFVVKVSDNVVEIIIFCIVSVILLSILVLGVIVGMMFLGEFKVDIINMLKSIYFGVFYCVKFVNFKIIYKYILGIIFYKIVVKNNVNDIEVVFNEKDECLINVYFYEVDLYVEILDGININIFNKVIMKVVLEDGFVKVDYVILIIFFKEIGNGSFDFIKKKYKLVIVCFLSKKGDQFMGVDGSKLWVKYLEVIC